MDKENDVSRGKGLEIFCCYASEDINLLNQLKIHLLPLQRQDLVVLRANIDISAGTEWEHEIDQYLQHADIILLLISPDFLASDYCYSKEMIYALKRHDAGEARVIPILLRSVHFQGAPFGKLQMLPTETIPIVSKKWHSLDEALYDVAEGIRKVVNELVSLKEKKAEEGNISSSIDQDADTETHSNFKALNQATQQEKTIKRSSQQAISLKRVLFAGLALTILISAFISVAGYQNHVQQVNAKSTSTAIAPLATATALENLYETSTNTLPTYDDPLTNNSKGLSWSEGQNCVFKDGAYHVINPQTSSFQICMAHNSNFRNFHYQVLMTIIKGSYGSLIFRSDDSPFNFYTFRVGQDGVYSFAFYKGNINTEVQHGPSPTFKQGPKQTNLISVIAQKSRFTFYVNARYVYSTSDTSFTSGELGLTAGSIGSPTEVIYNNAKIWTL